MKLVQMGPVLGTIFSPLFYRPHLLRLLGLTAPQAQQRPRAVQQENQKKKAFLIKQLRLPKKKAK